MAQEQSRADDLVQKLGLLDTFRYPQSTRCGSATKLMSTAVNYLRSRSDMPSVTSAVTGDVIVSEQYNAEQRAKIVRTLKQVEHLNNALKERRESWSLVNLDMFLTWANLLILGLFKEQEECKENIRSYSRAGTDPNDPQFPASVKYHLRGIATSGYHEPSITYVIYPTRRFGVNGLLGSRVEPQWWKLIYDTRYTAAVRIEVDFLITSTKHAAFANHIYSQRITEEQVLKDISQVYHNALLVYASEESLSVEGSDLQLPDPLRVSVST